MDSIPSFVWVPYADLYGLRAVLRISYPSDDAMVARLPINRKNIVWFRFK